MTINLDIMSSNSLCVVCDYVKNISPLDSRADSSVLSDKMTKTPM